MAGVLEQLFRPQQKTIYQDQKAMELEAAKEILAEVFRVRLSEVDEMIQSRFEDEDTGSMGSDDGLWPQEFCLEGCAGFKLTILPEILIRPSFASSSRIGSSSASLMLTRRLKSLRFIFPPLLVSIHKTLSRED